MQLHEAGGFVRRSGAWLALLALAALIGTTTHAGLVNHDVELAGLSLSAYPHFEYVTTFNLDQNVWIAIDPKQLPDAANQTCDVYIVNAKTAAQWMADPSLTGVGPTPVTVTFATLIQNSKFQIALGSQLGSRAEPCFSVGGSERCIGLGRAFDVVVDCDRNGTLSGPDYIDGHGDEAGVYVVHDTTVAEVSQGGTTPGLPAVCSDYQVPADLITSGFVVERTYAPDLAGMGPLPLVIISHGNGHQYNYYDYLQRHLASYGYIVMSHANNTGPGIDSAAETTLEHTDALLDLINDPACASRVAGQGICGSCSNTGYPCRVAGDCFQGQACTQEATAFDVCSLAGRIDPNRIVWIGHSRGGNGVVWAYTRLSADSQDPSYFDAEHYDADDVELISSMAPVDWRINGKLASPGNVPYHLIWGAGDVDVGGRPQPDVDDYARQTLAFQFLERAKGPRQSLYFHGGAHGWFHERCPSSGGGVDCAIAGASQVDQGGVHQIVRGYYLPLLKHYLEGNVAARDFFWRPWTSFRPQGAPNVDVALEYSSGPDPLRFVVDDYETNPSPSVSSSGQPIVQNVDPGFQDPDLLLEGLLEDNDCHYDFIRASQGTEEPAPLNCAGYPCLLGNCPCPIGSGAPSGGSTPCDLLCAGGSGFLAEQPTNGLTRSRADGLARGVALSWPAPFNPTPTYAYRTSGSFSKYTYLSFRVAQLPRHPNTLALDGPLEFTVALTDTAGITSRVAIGTYQAEVVEPYERIGPPGATHCFCEGPNPCCVPAGCNRGLSDIGWQAEFETVRIRVQDFLTNASGLNLKKLKEVRFEFGRAGDSPEGRIAIDDVEFVSK